MNEPDDRIAAALSRLAPAPRRDAVDERIFDRVRTGIVGDRARPQRIDRFTVLEEIGRGGMGVVYAVYDPKLDRRVALKLLFARGDEGRRRVLDEARMLARLAHPNVVPVFEAGAVDDRVFVAMELVRGAKLDGWLAARPRKPAEILDVLLAAGRGLVAAHAQGIVHRDFKPANVIVGDDRRVRVLDFGLAVTDPGAHDGDTSDSPGPHTAGAGTPGYMAPEQAAGEQVDARADQYSWCVVATEALTSHRDAAKLDGAGLPSAVVRALRRGLNGDPSKRFDSAAALLQAIERGRRRWPGWVAVASVAVGAAAGFLVGRPSQAACGDAETQLARVWTPARETQIRAAFDRSGLGYADDAADRVIAALEVQARGWASARAQTCDGDDATDASQVEDCLEVWRAEFDAFAGLLEEADAALVRRATSAIGGLDGWSQCRTPPTGVAPVPEGAETEVTAIRTALARARASLRVGRFAEGAEAARAQVQRATALGYAPVTAEARQIHGNALSHERAFKEATEELIEAATVASGAGHDEVVFEAASMLAYVFAHRSQIDRGLDWVRWAHAAQARLGRHEVDPYLAGHEAVLLKEAGRYDEAVAIYRAALDGPSADATARLVLLGNLAPALAAQRKVEEAMEVQQQAIDEAVRVAGLEHPTVTSMIINLSTIQSQAGDYDAAFESLERARERRVAELGPDHPALASIEQNIGGRLVDLGRDEEALAPLSRAAALVTKGHGGEHPDVGVILNSRAIALARLGRLDEAWDVHRRALRILQPWRDEHHPEAYIPVVWAATFALATGRDEQANAWAHEGLEIAKQFEPELRAEAQWLIDGAITPPGESAKLMHAYLLRVREHAQTRETPQ